jgi:hypothetical protein
VRQHRHGWFLRLYHFDGIKAFHVTNSIDDGVDFPCKLLAMRQDTFTTSKFNFPTWVEEIGTRKDDVGVVHVEMSSKSHKSDQSDTSKRCLGTLSRRQVSVAFTPDNTVIPYLESTMTFELADNTVGCAN